MSELPVVVIGAGPVGLAAAAELVSRGREVLVLERGTGPGASVAEWGHVRLFSPWSELTSPAGRALLEPTGWQLPDGSRYPTGSEWVAEYLRPLAAALQSVPTATLRYGAEVVAVTRRGRDRAVDAGRDTEPLMITIHPNERLAAAAVIDASGTWTTPNPLGADGVPAPGEPESAELITHRIPDLSDPAVAVSYAGRHVVVAGSGHSAFTALVGLTELDERLAPSRITWLLRREAVGQAFGGGSDDQLPARGALGERARRAVTSGRITVAYGFRTEEVRRRDGQLILVAADGRQLDAVDRVIALTGFRPDVSTTAELRLDLDPSLQAPTRLAPMIDPNVHSCGSVPPHGYSELSHPEPGFYVAGMKSYGRAPTFLALTGYEQVRSIVAAVTGDLESARTVELVLPETGVCSGDGISAASADADHGASCCGSSLPAGPELITLSPRVGG